MNDSDKIFGIPKKLVKIVGVLAIFFVVTTLISSQICISSTCTSTELITPEVAIGGTVALILMTMFPVALAPALLSGLGVWFLLKNFGWLHML